MESGNALQYKEAQNTRIGVLLVCISMGISMFEEEEAMKQTPETPPAVDTDTYTNTNTVNDTDTFAKRPVTPGFVILFFALVLLPFVLYYAYQWSKAGTTINTTITENDDLNNGLTGHWTFDGQDMNWASTTAEVLDRSTYSREGNVTNFTSSQAAIGKIGQALRFDGVNDYIDTNVDITSYISTSAYSISVWVRPTDNSGSSTATYLPGIIQDYEQYVWINNGHFKSQDKIWTGFFDGSIHQVGVSYNLNEWVHITTVFGNNTISMYKNGQLATSTASPDFSHMGGDLGLEIGRNGWQSKYFKGDIDDVRMYNRSLSASEVKRLYEQGATTHINTTIDTNDDLENGLVGHWTFDGPDMSTATVTDSSGNRLHLLTPSGFISSAGTPVIGKMGQALSFATSSIGSNYLFASATTTIDNLASITLAAWIRPRSLGESNRGMIFHKDGTCGSNPTTGWRFRLTTNNRILFQQGFATVDGAWETATNTFQFNTSWAHVAVTYAKGTGTTDPTIFINGEPVTVTETGTPSGAAGNDTTETFTVGNCSFATGDFDGGIDDPRIYNRALSATEVKRLYELGATTHINTTIDTNDDLENGLVGHWTFDGPKMAWASTTAEVLDSSASSSEGDMTGAGFDMSSVSIGKIGQGLSFDGVNDYITLGNNKVLDTTTGASICLWLYHRQDSISADSVLVSKFDGATGWMFWIDDVASISGRTNTITFLPNLSSSAGRVEGASNLIRPRTWEFYCGVFSGSTYTRLYKNGVLNQETTTNQASQMEDQNFGLYIGNSASAHGFFNGYLDDVRIYKRALSASEVKRLYELGNGR